EKAIPSTSAIAAAETAAASGSLENNDSESDGAVNWVPAALVPRASAPWEGPAATSVAFAASDPRGRSAAENGRPLACRSGNAATAITATATAATSAVRARDRAT